MTDPKRTRNDEGRDHDATQVPLAKGRPILEVEDLSVSFFVNGEWVPAVRNISYELAAGEVLAIVGESGSGKTQSSMSLVGLLPRNARATGRAELAGQPLLGLRGAAQRRVRGKEIAVIFQEPMTALNPVYPIGYQIVEALRSHFPMSPSAARDRAIELLTLVEIPEPERRFHAFPHQLSGGQRQRAMIAQALSCEPKLLIADEPTTALDVTVQAEILKLITDLRDRIDSGILLITHDMGVVADIADKMIVMKDGAVVERGGTLDIFAKPQHPYTQQLLGAVPHFGSQTRDADLSEGDDPPQPVGESAETSSPSLVKQRPTHRAASTDGSADPKPALTGEAVDEALRLADVVIEYPKRGDQPVFRAIDHVSFSVGRGEVLGLVGESGSGKSTIGRAAMGLLPVASGSLVVDGVELNGIKRGELSALRRRVGMVFQDPGSSLNPRMPVGESIAEPLFLHTDARGKQLSQQVENLLDQVHLPRAMRNRYPHELSGGQRQRIGIARALALEPTFLVADEPTSALDVSVQARVLALFAELQERYGFGCLFISHDLAVVEMLATRVAVLRHGNLIELGATAQIVRSPQEEYTQRLVAAVPVPDPVEQRARRARRDALLEESGVS